MDCRKDEPRISAFLDGELRADEAADVERHLARCSSCRELARELGETSRALARRQESEIVADPGFVVRFRARRDELSIAPWCPWWTWRELALRVLPLAAVVLLAALLSIVSSARDDRNFAALELEALGSAEALDATSAGEPVLSIALAPFPAER